MSDKELISRGAELVTGDLILRRKVVGQYRNGQFMLTPEGVNELENIVDVVVKEAASPREDIGRAKLEKRAELQKLRNTLEFGGFTWNSYTFDSDMVSQQRLNQACQQALLANMTNASFSRNWTLSNGEILENVTAEQMLEICSTLANHVNNLHTKSQELYKKIDLATTLEEVVAVTWS